MITTFEELVEYLKPVINKEIFSMIHFNTKAMSLLNDTEGIEGFMGVNIRGTDYDIPEGIYIKNNLYLNQVFNYYIKIGRIALLNKVETLMINHNILQPNEKINPILWACRMVFHEIGHVVDFNDSKCRDIKEFSLREKNERINYEVIKNQLKKDVQTKLRFGKHVSKNEIAKVNDKIEELYRNIPSEKFADNYALDVIANNIEMIRKLF